MPLRSATRKLRGILKKPSASNRYDPWAREAQQIKYRPGHRQRPSNSDATNRIRSRRPNASCYCYSSPCHCNQTPSGYHSQPPSYASSPPTPYRPEQIYHPALCDGLLAWHLWDPPPLDSVPTDPATLHPVHTLTIYIPALALWMQHAWGPLVVQSSDLSALTVPDALGAVHEYLHEELTVEDVMQLRFMGGRDNSGAQVWTWEGEALQTMLARVDRAGVWEVGTAPRRVDLLMPTLWYDKMRSVVCHGQHAELELILRDG
ncbi:hypothetical protein BD626DRAFT_566180 [Schizophyllum amplum]|uniref:DUF6699 domain-containing protein n=1 Tax=Schizophyllum amplum TaxID=97359 RepID=A0A550CQU2_9AGAR|nr:hypothetical protein BD626DRAFT_566180 [Auriculariopsis ampla]